MSGQASGFRVWGSGLSVQRFGLTSQGLWFTVQGIADFRRAGDIWCEGPGVPRHNAASGVGAAGFRLGAYL